MQLLDIAWVGLGGGVGSLLRWGLGRLVNERYHGSFPLSTFIINISGAFVIGFLTVYFNLEWTDRYGSVLHAGVLTGILGGYTTFSTMQLDAAKLSGKDKAGQAVTYLILSVLVGLGSAWLGATLARDIF